MIVHLASGHVLQFANLNMAHTNLVDFPIKNGGSGNTMAISVSPELTNSKQEPPDFMLV